MYKFLFILEETIYLCKLLSTIEVDDYDLLTSMVEVVKIVEGDVFTKKMPSSQNDQTYCEFKKLV